MLMTPTKPRNTAGKHYHRRPHQKTWAWGLHTQVLHTSKIHASKDRPSPSSSIEHSMSHSMKKCHSIKNTHQYCVSKIKDSTNLDKWSRIGKATNVLQVLLVLTKPAKQSDFTGSLLVSNH